MNNDTRDTYHSDTSRVSKSGLDLIRQSPYHYWAKYLNPERPKDKGSDTFLLGSLANDVLLQRHLLESQYVVAPTDAPNRPSKRQINAAKPSPETLEAIKFWDSFNEKNAGKNIVSQEQWDKSIAMRDAVWAHPSARKLLACGGVAEKTHYFTEPNTGAQCKFRPDWKAKNGFLVDLKTTGDASPEGFSRSVFNYRYHVQAAFYSDGLYYCEGTYPKGFVFIAVEKEYPFAVGVYYADEEVMERGYTEYMEDLETYVQCKQSGIWPGYSEKIVPIQVPAWMRKKF